MSFPEIYVQLNQDLRTLVSAALGHEAQAGRSELKDAITEEIKGEFYQFEATKVSTDQIQATALGGFVKPDRLVELHRSSTGTQSELMEIYQVMENAQRRLVHFLNLLTKMDPGQFAKSEFYYRTTDGVHLLKSTNKEHGDRVDYLVHLDDSLGHSISVDKARSSEDMPYMHGVRFSDMWSEEGLLSMNVNFCPRVDNIVAQVRMTSFDGNLVDNTVLNTLYPEATQAPQ